MLISSSGAPGERRPAPSHGAMRAISCGPRVHRLSILTIALMGGVFASSQAYALNFAEAREIARTGGDLPGPHPRGQAWTGDQRGLAGLSVCQRDGEG